jgi:pimeloyl-ACP methyl ester carboxylesterase
MVDIMITPTNQPFLPFILLLLVHYLLHDIVAAFEVPFPPSAAEIRASVVLPTPQQQPVPVTQQVLLGSGTTAEIITCLPHRTPSSSSSQFDTKLFFSQLFDSFVGTDKKLKQQPPGFVSSSTSTDEKPILAFIHGSFHAAWCWSEHYMPHFASLGYATVALSLQGTGGTPPTENGATKVKIKNHVDDLNAFLIGLSDNDGGDDEKAHGNLGLDLGKSPRIVLIGHSFGGLAIMKWLEQYYDDDDVADNDGNCKDAMTGRRNRRINLAGVSLLCSVPPSGNGKMTMRFLLRSPIDSWKITSGFVIKKAITDKSICRTLFFDDGISEEEIEQYQQYFKRDAIATIDLIDLGKQLPSALVDRRTGRAPFVNKLPSTSLVVAAADDFIVDLEGSKECARYFGLDDPIIVDSPHDVMLGQKWKNGADAILDWLQRL